MLLDDFFHNDDIYIIIEQLKDYDIFNLLVLKKYDEFKNLINLQKNLKILSEEKNLSNTFKIIDKLSEIKKNIQH